MGINVLSLCDGIACARIALDRCDIEVDNYFASEIKSHAIKCAIENWPEIIEIGDVTQISYSNGILHTPQKDYEINFDLVCFGFPCQSLSILMPADQRIGLEDLKKSGLFYECFRILTEVNPKYFFIENVASMKEKDKKLLSQYIGCSPIKIDSQIIAPAMRKRLYWTNIPLTPLKEYDCSLTSILENGYTERKKARALIANSGSMVYEHTPSLFRRYYKSRFGTLIFENEENYNNCIKIFEKYKDLSAAEYKEITKLDKDFIKETDKIRLLTQTELEACMTVPAGYTKMLTYKEAANVLGDGWTINVITKFFENIK